MFPKKVSEKFPKGFGKVVAKLPADLLVRPPTCLPNWKISGKVDGQHAGKLDILTTKPAKSDNFGQHLQ